MRILLAYDGSECARAAIADLRLAGLPSTVETHVMTVAEVQPELVSSTLDPGYGASFVDASLTLESTRALTDAAEREAIEVAEEGAGRLRALFPTWNITVCTRSDPPAAGILDEADRWGADLVVVGSHGRSAVARVFYGSVSQKVTKYARTSVRVARGRAEAEPESPPRVLIALDGSAEAHLALEAVVHRQWPPGTQARILTVVDAALAMAFPLSTGQDVIKSVQEGGLRATEQLTQVGIEAAATMRRGDPKRAILAEAEEWKAHCIFIGPHGLGAGRRFLLGTSASAIVSRAHCSVEVVRKVADSL